MKLNIYKILFIFCVIFCSCNKSTWTKECSFNGNTYIYNINVNDTPEIVKSKLKKGFIEGENFINKNYFISNTDINSVSREKLDYVINFYDNKIASIIKYSLSLKECQKYCKKLNIKKDITILEKYPEQFIKIQDGAWDIIIIKVEDIESTNQPNFSTNYSISFTHKIYSKAISRNGNGEFADINENELLNGKYQKTFAESLIQEVQVTQKTSNLNILNISFNDTYDKIIETLKENKIEYLETSTKHIIGNNFDISFIKDNVFNIKLYDLNQLDAQKICSQFNSSFELGTSNQKDSLLKDGIFNPILRFEDSNYKALIIFEGPVENPIYRIIIEKK